MKPTALQVSKSVIMIFIVWISLYSTYRIGITKLPHALNFIGKDSRVSLYDKRFEAIKTALPPYGFIGYIMDTPDKTNSDPIHRQFHKCHLAQYSLSPRVLILHDAGSENASLYEFVVGDFHNGIPNPDFFIKNKLIYLRDFGDGIVLLKRGEKK